MPVPAMARSAMPCRGLRQGGDAQKADIGAPGDENGGEAELTVVWMKLT